MKYTDLGQLVKIQKGKKLEEVYLKSSDSIRYIQIEDLRNDENIKYTLSNVKSACCNKNDILIAWDGANAGTTGFGLDGAIGSTLAKLTPVKEYFTPFVGRFLQSKFTYLRGSCTGATIPHISKLALSKIKIPLPPLPEQKRIAEILDKADALRQKNKQLLAAYDELLQATFLDMFGDPVANPMGWKVVTLGPKIEKIQIGPFGSQLHKSDYLEYGIPLINPTNIKGNEILIAEAACISEAKYESMPEYHLFDGDIVMARRGDLSKVALVKKNGLKMFCGTGSLYIRFSGRLNAVFLFKMLSHEKTTKYLEAEARGVTMPNLNKSIINKIPIFLPPISLQNQFAQIVENIVAQKTLVKQSLQESDDLFNGLVQKAFGGEL